ncbi:MAG: hypothetical protein Q8Q49_00510, partial [bacterium]|nr:hypothetical protein [bacterium]
MRKFLLFVVILLLLVVFPSRIFASEYFSTSYYVTYTVKEDGTTRATIKVTLTNKTKDYFASSYKIQVGFENIDNLAASDPDGPLTTKKASVEGGTEIEASFNKHVVGEGNKLTYAISFDTPDIARKDGSVWEINIPGLENSEEF